MTKKEVKTIPSKDVVFLKVEVPTSRVPKSFGEKAADRLSEWAGSWTFILFFLGFLVLWMIVNSSWLLFGKAWDPKPFIMLNLVLSCLAAFQAPVILMSQNRQAKTDRIRAQYDYTVNRKAEKEIQDIKKQLNRIEKRLTK